MSDELEKTVNTDKAESAESGLSQEKFADLFKNLDESVINKMLESSGVTDEDLAEAEVITAAPEVTDHAGEGLTAEHIGHLLKVLGDDIINDMLEDAGLTAEDLDSALDEDQPAGDADSTAADAPDPVKKKKRRRSRRKGSMTRRFLFVLIFVGIIALVAAGNKIYNSVTINTHDPIQYSEHTDEISADEGSLNVNNVSVKVPTNGSEEYSISYSWSEEDDKYPSVPHAITAIYSGEEDSKLYSISLYRNETVPKKNIKKGKKASNWFDDWTKVSEGDILQAPLKSGDINGFYIYPQPPEDDSAVSDYNDYSYYFAVKDKEGISIYVIEGVCLDPERDTEFRTIMDNCIHSISIK